MLIYTDTGDVLLLERLNPTGFWQSVTGSLAWDETPLQTAEREVAEETGLNVSGRLIDCETVNRYPILPAWRPRYDPDVDHNTEHVFRITYSHRPDIQLNPDEHHTFRWLCRDEAARLASSKTNQDAILRYVGKRT